MISNGASSFICLSYRHRSNILTPPIHFHYFTPPLKQPQYDERRIEQRRRQQEASLQSGESIFFDIISPINSIFISLHLSPFSELLFGRSRPILRLSRIGTPSPTPSAKSCGQQHQPPITKHQEIMAGSKKTKTPTKAAAAASAAPAKMTMAKKRKSKVGKSVKPNFNTYIYRVLKEVRVPRAAAAYDPPVWFTIIAWRPPHARGLTIGHWLWQ